MRPMPSCPLDPRIKRVWRINDALWLTVVWLCCALPFFFIGLASDEGWACLVSLGFTVAYILLMVLCLGILPPIRYARWRYELSDDFLDISRGIFWRKRFVIPFIRVQNTDTRQGPILRAFGLSSVTVSTAAGSHEIPGLDAQQAEILRDRAAELARLAREDV